MAKIKRCKICNAKGWRFYSHGKSSTPKMKRLVHQEQCVKLLNYKKKKIQLKKIKQKNRLKKYLKRKK